MIALLANPIVRYALGGLGIALLLGGAYAWIRHDAVSDERNARAGDTLKKIETDRKDREKNDEKARSLDDTRALECLRSPAGCR